MRDAIDWAHYRRRKGAVKLHLLLDHAGYLPTFALITEGKQHEVRMARGLKLSKGSIIVVDRGIPITSCLPAGPKREFGS